MKTKTIAAREFHGQPGAFLDLAETVTIRIQRRGRPPVYLTATPPTPPAASAKPVTLAAHFRSLKAAPRRAALERSGSDALR